MTFLTNEAKQKKNFFLKILIYICAGILAAGGIAFRTILGLSDIKTELINFTVPVVIVLITGLLWNKLPIHGFTTKHPFISALIFTAAGVLTEFIAISKRKPGNVIQVWSSFFFCIACVTLLYALKQTQIKGLLLFLLYDLASVIFLWKTHTTAGAAIFACITVILLFFIIRRNWFGGSRFYQICILILLCIFLILIYLSSSSLFFGTTDRILDKIDIWRNPIQFMENTAARITTLSAKLSGPVESCIAYDHYVELSMNSPLPGYLLSSVLYHFGWIYIIPVILLMLLIIIIGFYLCKEQMSINFYPKTMCLYLLIQFTFYLLQTFGVGIVRMLYVPFFSSQIFGGILSLLSIFIITRTGNDV